MNSFFRFNSNNTVWLLLVTLIASTIYSMLQTDFDLYLLIPLGLALIFIWFYFKQTKLEVRIIGGLYHLSKQIQQGKLEYRITDIPLNSELYDIAWNFNEAVDQMETYMREVGTSFQAAQNKQFYRKTQPQGINGLFTEGLEKIDVSLDMMKENHFNNVRDELFSQLGQMKTENLLSSLHRTENDLTTITNQMTQVETISSKASNIAVDSKASLGAVISKASPEVEQAMSDYAMHLGSAFQLVDDLLDYSESSETIGKNIGDDLAEGKPTLPLIYAMKHGTAEQASIIRTAIEEGQRDRIDEIITIIEQTGAIDYTAQAAQNEVQRAISTLSILDDSPYKEALIGLANFSVSRSF